MLELSYKKILFIALPLMFGTFVQSMIGIIDGAFVSSLGNTAYNAVGNGSIMYIALFMLCSGLADGTQITIAKKYGEEKNMGDRGLMHLFYKMIENNDKLFEDWCS